MIIEELDLFLRCPFTFASRLHVIGGILRQLICCLLHRQIIARGLLDVFRDFSNNEEDFLTVMEIVVRLSEDAGLKVVLFVCVFGLVFFYFS